MPAARRQQHGDNMAIQDIGFRITGITPILMHNGQTADPLNQFARAMKKCSGKRNKTDEDLEELSRLEWWAGLYIDQAPTIDGATVTPAPNSRLVIPAHLLDSCIREGARKSKMGKQASAGCIVNGDGAFNHQGPANLAKLAESPAYYHRAAVKVGTSKVMRTRPIFTSWEVSFSVSIDSTVIEPEMVLQALESAGKLVGIGDWRPGAPRGGSFGRFEAEGGL